jgi:hypothetical protein
MFSTFPSSLLTTCWELARCLEISRCCSTNGKVTEGNIFSRVFRCGMEVGLVSYVGGCTRDISIDERGMKSNAPTL